jgi:hypothetical protein
LQRREARLAHHPLEHHAAGDRNGDRLRLQFFVGHVGIALLQVGGVMAGLEVVGKGGPPQRPLLRELLAALFDQLVFFDREATGRCFCGFTHPRLSICADVNDSTVDQRQRPAIAVHMIDGKMTDRIEADT